MVLLALTAYILLAPMVSASAGSGESARMVDEEGRHLPVLRGGWYLWDPYQYNELRNGTSVLTGLDVELTRTIARAAGFAVDYSYRPWHEHIAQLRDGHAELASGATWTADRAEFVRYSRPYRQETNVLYLPRGEASHYPFDDIQGMLRTFRDTGMRLGVISGFAYADPAVNAYIVDPENARYIVYAENDYENFRNLMDDRIDGFLADRLVASTSAWRGGWRELVDEHPFRFSVDIHFMFSKETVDPETVARFNEAILAHEETGETRRIISSYLFPLFLAQTLDSRWFSVFDIIGTVAFAISGILIAIRERYSLLGALVLAALPAVGGGALRDLLVGREPIAVLASPLYLSLVGATVLFGFLMIRAVRILRQRDWLRIRIEALGRHGLIGNLYQVSDAVGIAAFTVTGVAVAVTARTEPLWLWAPLLAMITAAGGGILRDLVRQSGSIASLKGEFYAEVPLIWGLLLSLYLTWQTPILEMDHLVMAVIVTMAGAFLTRMTAVMLRMRSPAFA
ncbi:TRIC cation channel family protein [Thioalkalivibrio thiocyanodenitrificans]|uniref:TRIC cation channel family protein n=1 Tax=Thioalkalivibrio thiocyanodenitrificans TaxID=243063 RepID=UPI0018DE73A4|nr:TRIC cation channel family protein [Thioalkalivibrio thiocyanodenitrificans]